MLSFEKVTLRRGPRILFDQASFTVHAKDKVGVIGANGCGKSSLFALIRRELEEDGGTFSSSSGLTIASVRQETPEVATSALEYVIEGDATLCELEKQLADAEAKQDGMKVAVLHQKIDDIEGYSARARASTLLNGLGFSTEQEAHAVSTFSGGWRMRLNLAQALMCRSNVLLLDEPTNHLDFEAVLWLERWLHTYQGAMLLISHDRDFLDRVIKRVVHIEQGVINLYTGNYSDFERLRTEKLIHQQSQYERQQKQIDHMKSFITRFKAKATKAKQAQSRVKALERMEMVAAAHVDSPFDFEFSNLDFMHSPLLQLKDAQMGYGDSTLLSSVNFAIRPGDRIGLLGENGAGKSTLIKTLFGEANQSHGDLIMQGERVEAKVLDIGYFAQHQLEQLHPEMSPLQHLTADHPESTESDLRKFLGGFDFKNDKALEPIAQFSGGEKARLVLAMIVYTKPNILLLDEPTNHLDLEMRHAMTMALQSFEGAVVLVSHDRHMIRTVCDQLYLVANGGVSNFEGDLDEYAKWIVDNRLAQKEQLAASVESVVGGQVDIVLSKKDQRKLDAEKRKLLQPLKKNADQLENKLEKQQSRKAELDEMLADSSLYSDENKDKLTDINKEYGELQKVIEEIEIQWLDALEAYEKAENTN